MSDDRKKIRMQQILEAAVKLSIKDGYLHIQRRDVATRAKCADATVTFHFSTMHKLRHKVLRHAVKNNILPIIAQGVVSNDKYVKRMVNAEIKKQALNTLL